MDRKVGYVGCGLFELDNHLERIHNLKSHLFCMLARLCINLMAFKSLLLLTHM